MLDPGLRWMYPIIFYLHVCRDIQSESVRVCVRDRDAWRDCACFFSLPIQKYHERMMPPHQSSPIPS